MVLHGGEWRSNRETANVPDEETACQEVEREPIPPFHILNSLSPCSHFEVPSPSCRAGAGRCHELLVSQQSAQSRTDPIALIHHADGDSFEPTSSAELYPCIMPSLPGIVPIQAICLCCVGTGHAMADPIDVDANIVPVLLGVDARRCSTP